MEWKNEFILFFINQNSLNDKTAEKNALHLAQIIISDRSNKNQPLYPYFLSVESFPTCLVGHR